MDVSTLSLDDLSDYLTSKFGEDVGETFKGKDFAVFEVKKTFFLYTQTWQTVDIIILRNIFLKWEIWVIPYFSQ